MLGQMSHKISNFLKVEIKLNMTKIICEYLLLVEKYYFQITPGMTTINSYNINTSNKIHRAFSL